MASKRAAKPKAVARGEAPKKKSPPKPVRGQGTPRAQSLLPAGYGELLEDLKTRVRTAQLKATLAVNRELIQLYWDIGLLIVERQGAEGWGKRVVERLADDIQRSFPGLSGFSRSNVFRMRAFYETYGAAVANAKNPLPKSAGKKVAQAVRQLAPEKVAQPVRQLSGTALPEVLAGVPWGHNIVLLQKLSDTAQRLWYAAKTIEHGWSRAVLAVQIESNLFARQGKAVTNFAATLPVPQSDMAQQALKDPYVFDFLMIGEEAHERELETGLVDHVQKFLLELGAGFAFVGRQVPIVVGDDDFYIDLLFYHLKLRSFIVVDLKMQQFTPEDAGKLNFYLSAVDSQFRHPDDKPSIGLVLCKTRNRLIAEYALRDISKPIGVAEWQTQLVHSLPEPLRSNLPTIEEIENEFGGAE
jgi:predicted nuclease of restriction endonuclease-like (RecB) superfamily